MGRVLPEFFPKIFGPKENEALDSHGSLMEMKRITDLVNRHGNSLGQHAKSVEEVAMGFIRVANEAMCRPIRALTQMKGYDVTQHVLACFGGAGGQHACAIAMALGIESIFVHRYAGILSAVGIGLADVVAEAQEPAALVLDSSSRTERERRLDVLLTKAEKSLKEQGFTNSSLIQSHRFLNLRYDGTDVPIMIQEPPDGDYAAAFEAAYKREFGFVLTGRSIVIDDLRVRSTGQGVKLEELHELSAPGDLPDPVCITSSYFEIGGRQSTPTYLLGDLSPGHEIPGPALLIDKISTIVVEPMWTANITVAGDVLLKSCKIIDSKSSENSRSENVRSSVLNEHELGKGLTSTPGTNEIPCDPIQLAIFSHRFMGIAEQMGRVLQRTSVSVNIKERLDFSCALFDPEGNLVSNAPHLPVHLGAMSEAVKYQIHHYGPGGPGEPEGLQEGDVIISNHPQLAGGSHLPDITVITPVFNNGEIVFFVASRGHHADIGGISPGSMPPHSYNLAQEGAAIISFKLVHQGKFDEDRLSALLEAPGKSGIEGAVGTRNLSDNISDLKAQTAANQKGISLVQSLIDEYSLPIVQSYMRHIQSNAEAAVREMLISFSLQQGLDEVGTVHASDQMDDGTPIHLSVTINRKEGSALFDFSGTGPQVYGNTNAPPAVTRSAIIYALRCMVTRDIPLNHGCMAPITIKIPEGSLLCPYPEAAVVGGNVLTSQRVTDVVLKSFAASAASQGCMNNLTFGDAGFGYYETIAGGAGAGPGWHGRSGIHTHMTNTRITDPEILERRYPVVLHQFSLRQQSGGRGLYKGGDGVVREIEFLRPLTVSILSERRSIAPFGLLGGKEGSKGVNLWIKRDGNVVSLGGKATVSVESGDRLKILTPGGGGYGPTISENEELDPEELQKSTSELLKSVKIMEELRKNQAGGSSMEPEDGHMASKNLAHGSVHEYRRLQESA